MVNGNQNLGLLVDLYELTMIQGYYLTDPRRRSVFDMFFRKPPFAGGFTVFAGLENLLETIETLHFEPGELEYLDSLDLFHKEFLDHLSTFRFQGDILALPEGSVVFPGEPLLRVEGRLIETQLLESIILNFINFQSLIATKAARIVLAAGGSGVIEFGLRRAQGVDGALSASRAAFIGGAVATSNVLAGRLYGIPVRGTMAHSWVMNFASEREAFERYAALYPENAILLVDTYDTLHSGVPNAIEVFRELERRGIRNYGIRLDSGDLEYLSREARRAFDREGLTAARIIASNELDEWIISELKKNNAPIDAWGVGTKMVTGDPDPALSGVYKICATEGEGGFEPCIKISNNPRKITNPGIKNVLRFFDDSGGPIADLIYLREEEDELQRAVEEGRPVRFNHPVIDTAYFLVENYHSTVRLLQPVMEGGRRSLPTPALQEIQARTRSVLERLDETYRRLLNPHEYKISISDRLKELKRKLTAEHLSGR